MVFFFPYGALLLQKMNYICIKQRNLHASEFSEHYQIRIDTSSLYDQNRYSS